MKNDNNLGETGAYWYDLEMKQQNPQISPAHKNSSESSIQFLQPQNTINVHVPGINTKKVRLSIRVLRSDSEIGEDLLITLKDACKRREFGFQRFEEERFAPL